ncbi:MAG: response regulator transcription factor [Vulcanimicrobiaceae bacterium]
MKLMIVDDSNIIRRMIARSIGDYGFDVRTASDGMEAVQVFEQFRPDLVTMDITMPRLDGIVCIEQLLKRRPDTKILVISALADKATAVEAVERGAHGFVLKPFTEKRINDELRHVIDGDK